MKCIHIQYCFIFIILFFLNGSGCTPITFNDSVSSHVKFSDWNATISSTLNITFKTISLSGLVVTIGDKPRVRSSENFMQLMIENGMLNFITLKTTTRRKIWRRQWTRTNVDDSEWHNVTLSKDGLSFYLDKSKFKTEMKNGTYNLTSLRYVLAGAFPKDEIKEYTCRSKIAPKRYDFKK